MATTSIARANARAVVGYQQLTCVTARRLPEDLLSRRDNLQSGRPPTATAPVNLTTNNGLRVAERGQPRRAALPPTAAGVARRRPRRQAPSVVAAELPQAPPVDELPINSDLASSTGRAGGFYDAAN